MSPALHLLPSPKSQSRDLKKSRASHRFMALSLPYPPQSASKALAKDTVKELLELQGLLLLY